MKFVFVTIVLFLNVHFLSAQTTEGYINPEDEINRLKSFFRVAYKNCYYGIINKMGDTIIPFKYGYANVIDSNLFALKTTPYDSTIIFYNHQNKYLFSAKGISAEKLDDKYIRVTQKKGILEPRGIVDKKGK